MVLNEMGKRASGLAAVGLNRLCGSRAGNRLGILVYHRVATPVAGLPEPTLNVPPQRFREQIQGLLARGFVVRPLRDVLACRREHRPIPPQTVVLTFDDGHASVYHNAWPVLRAIKVPATLFLSTAYLDADAPFPFDSWAVAHRGRLRAECCRPLSTEECREMAEGAICELGAHTHTHRDFRGKPAEFREDLRTSVEVLRSRFRARDATFAFPFGNVRRGFAGAELAAAARQAGVICGLTTESRLVDTDSDPFQWGRFNVYAWDTARTIAAKLQGWYSWAPRAQEWLWARLGGQAAGSASARGLHREHALADGHSPSFRQSTSATHLP
jgi:peptidoglycan/xylan/chitin deacetylase (PgdA/CDA1 family)